MKNTTVPHEGAPFRGVSRSFVTVPAPRAWPTCKGCGSSLYGRFERTVSSRTHEVEVFRCRCGTTRRVPREIDT